MVSSYEIYIDFLYDVLYTISIVNGGYMKVTLYILLALVSLNAQANIIDSSQTSPTAVNCNSFCGQFANTPTTLNSNTWGSADDQMCFLLGAPTSDDPSVNVMPSKMPTLPTGMVDRCKWHNSQVEQYCLAYLAIEGNTSNKTDAGVAAQDISQKQASYGSEAGNIAALTLDFATIGACTAACFSDPTSGGLMNKICGAAAVGENVFEMTQTARMASSDTQAAIDSAFVASGILSGGASYVEGMKKSANQDMSGMLRAEQEVQGNELSALDRAKANKASCLTAGLMTVVAGIRTANIVAMNNISSQVCSNIQSLLTSGSVLPSTSASIGGITAAPSSSGSTASFAAQQLLNQIAQCPTTTCVQALLASNQQAQSSAASGGNLGSLAGNALSAVPQAQSLAAQAAQTGSISSGLASLGGGSIPQGFGDALGNIASAAQKDAIALGSALGIPLAQMPMIATSGNTASVSRPLFDLDSFSKKPDGKIAKSTAQEFRGAVQPKAQPSALPTVIAKVSYTMADIVAPTGENSIFPHMEIQGGSNDTTLPLTSNGLKKGMILISVLALGLVIRKKRNNS